MAQLEDSDYEETLGWKIGFLLALCGYAILGFGLLSLSIFALVGIPVGLIGLVMMRAPASHESEPEDGR